MVALLIGFVSRSVFIKTLGAEYNGIQGLLANILSMLSIAELGFGTAIGYHLYKPVAEENIGRIRTIIKYYKHVYHTVAIVVFIMGIIILPVIPMIVGEVSITENVRFLFLLYLLNTVFSYLVTYKRSLLYANQKNYITTAVGSVFTFLRNIIQIAILLLTKNFIFYIIIQIILTILENVVINIIVNSKYSYVKDLHDVEQMPNELKKDITTKVKGLLFHKLAGFIVLGTDNIIISMTKGLGVVAVGMYSNYNMIIAQVKSLFNTVIYSLTASVGNLLVEKDKLKSRNIYKSILLLNSWAFCFGSISIYCMIEPFVKIWIGGEYLLSKFVLITLVLNLYMQGMRSTSMIFSDAAGIFYENRFVPLIESTINLIASLVFVKIFGFAGVFLGTITSTMVLFLYSYPKYVYKLVLEGTYEEYFKLHIKHSLITLIICFITSYLSSFVMVPNVWLELILNGGLCLVVPNVIYLLFAIKMPEFQFYKEKIKYILKGKVK